MIILSNQHPTHIKNNNQLISMINSKYMDVSKNSGTPKSSILIGISIINHPFWGTPIFRNTYIYL